MFSYGHLLINILSCCGQLLKAVNPTAHNSDTKHLKQNDKVDDINIETPSEGEFKKSFMGTPSEEEFRKPYPAVNIATKQVISKYEDFIRRSRNGGSTP